MKTVDEMIYEAIVADESLMAIIGDRVVSTCFEIPPDQLDNTEVPNIIITDDGFTNNVTTKDCVWEGGEDEVRVTVDIAGNSPQEVQQIMRKVRKAVETYIGTLYTQGEGIPELESLSSDGIAWDWMKPCYYQRLNYQCITNADTEDGQEDN